MKVKHFALMSSGVLTGAALVMMIGLRAEDGPDVEVAQQHQVAANTATDDNRQAGISMDELRRRMEEKYSGSVTEVELDREWSGDVYEIEVKTHDGYEWDVEIDADTGEILKEERERED